MTDFYKILGVEENASQDEIKKAFRKLSLKNHPDKGGDLEKFKEISEAYDTLSNEEKRQQYDMQRRFGGGFGGGGSMSNMGIPEEILRHMFGGGGNGNFHFQMGGMPFQNMGMGGGGGGGPNIRIFRNGVEVSQNQMNKPVPIIKTIEITLEQSFTGYSYPLEVERWIQEEGVKRVEKETIYVDIPQGIDNSEIIILRDRGNILSENNKGDIKLFIKVLNHSTFERRGLDLIFKKTITLCESLCGFSFNIHYLNDKILTINNSDRVVKSGFQKAIPGMGLKRGNNRGSLIILFDVSYPEQLTQDQKKLIKEALL
jgi:DnaJ-class molecular chaperone